MVTLREIFLDLDSLRMEAEIPIRELAPLAGVTELAYINWRKGTTPASDREPALRELIERLDAALEAGMFPVKHDHPQIRVAKRRAAMKLFVRESENN